MQEKRYCANNVAPVWAPQELLLRNNVANIALHSEFLAGVRLVCLLALAGYEVRPPACDQLKLSTPIFTRPLRWRLAGARCFAMYFFFSHVSQPLAVVSWFACENLLPELRLIISFQCS